MPVPLSLIFASTPALVALIAPRPFIAENAEDDLIFPLDAAKATLKQATADLHAAGLEVGNVQNYRADGVVMTQSPSGGKLARGSLVDLVLRRNGRGGN